MSFCRKRINLSGISDTLGISATQASAPPIKCFTGSTTRLAGRGGRGQAIFHVAGGGSPTAPTGYRRFRDVVGRRTHRGGHQCWIFAPTDFCPDITARRELCFRWLGLFQWLGLWRHRPRGYRIVRPPSHSSVHSAFRQHARTKQLESPSCASIHLTSAGNWPPGYHVAAQRSPGKVRSPNFASRPITVVSVTMKFASATRFVPIVAPAIRSPCLVG